MGRINFVFDVPSTDMYSATIVDTQGRIVETLVKDRLIRGEAKLGFNTSHLLKGLYLVIVTSEKWEILRGKFIVN